MKKTIFYAFLAVIAGVRATLPCSTDAIGAILPPTMSLLYAIPNGANSSFGNQSDIAYPLNATGLPAFCAIQVNVSQPDSSFVFALWLPVQWNQRLMTVGNGGYAGGVNYMNMGLSGLQYGFATVSTDTGHNSTSLDGSFALDNPQAQLNFGGRSIHGSVVPAKQIVTAYYNSPIKYSYYSGCSWGGQEGMKTLQDYPEDFDGVLAGAPAWWATHMLPWFVKLGTYNLPNTSDHHIPESLFSVVGAEVFRQCDGVDGLIDNIIMDPRECDFYYDSLLCNTSQTENCLTIPQLDTLYHIYNDWVEDNQTFIYPHLELGSEGQWGFMLTGPEPESLGYDYVRDFLLSDPTWQWQDMNYSIVEWADQRDPGNLNATNYNITAFYTRGGKLLQYHGYSDAVIPPGSSMYYYNHVLETLRPEGIELSSWYRLFMVPGMFHCTNSVNDAPWYFAGANQASVLGTDVYSVPGFEDPLHDALLALMEWVEKDVAPDQIIATKFVNDTIALGVESQRPLCPYPAKAQYVQGDIKNASSFTCGQSA